MSFQHREYARSIGGGAEPVRLERAAGWLLRRTIGDGPSVDLAGPYPIFVCEDWSQITADLESLDTEYIASVVFVADPFSEVSIREDVHGFDLKRPFKTHYVVRLDRPWRSFVRKSSRKYAKRARQQFDIRVVDNPIARANDFYALYCQLLENRCSEAVRPISSETISAQLALPGVTLFEVRDADRTFGYGLFCRVENRAYAYLMGMSETGRSRYASYGLYAAALDYFEDRVETVDLGGNAGRYDDSEDGLSLFKMGWANETRASYLCGRILNERLYRRLCREAESGDTDFFPAYRAGRW